MEPKVDNLTILREVIECWIQAAGADVVTAELNTDRGFLFNFLLHSKFSAAVQGYICIDRAMPRVWLKTEIALCGNIGGESFLYECMNLNRTIPHSIRLAINEPYLILSYFTDTNTLTKEAVWENLVHLNDFSSIIYDELKRLYPSLVSYVDFERSSWRKVS